MRLPCALLLLLFCPVGGRAVTLPPACGPLHRGAEACLAGQTCTCDWFRGGSITDERPGWRWACRIEQMCGGVPPADDGAGGLSAPVPTDGIDDDGS